MGKSREAEHQAFLDWLIKLVTGQRVDALIIAGDSFDTDTPPSYARRLFSRFIVSLQKTPCQQLVVMIGVTMIRWPRSMNQRSCWPA